MRRSWLVAVVVMAFLMGEGLVLAQGRGGAGTRNRVAAKRPTKNPLEGKPESIKEGGAKFRTRCSGCHGVDARGNVAPDLTVLWSSGRTDDRIFDVVRTGVPGTDMPAADPTRILDSDIWETLAYLRTVSVTTPPQNPTGNAQNGERIFRTNCARCHMVNGRGGQLGPDLSRIGAARPQRVMASKLRAPTTDNIRPGFEPVTLVMRDGQRIRAVKKNEDEFSIQIMDTREQIQGYLKANLTEVINEKESLMPVYGPEQLNENDFNDLMRYLGTLRGTESASR